MSPLEVHARFVEHAKNCAGCSTSLEVGTWLVHRCPTGKRLAWELTDAMLKNKKTD